MCEDDGAVDADMESDGLEPMYEPAIALMSSSRARHFLNPLTILQALSTSDAGGPGNDGRASARNGISPSVGLQGEASPSCSPPLHIVSALLVRILREHNHKTMETRMVKAMEKRINLDATSRRQALHRQRIVMTEQVVCSSRGASLGNKTVFVKFPEKNDDRSSRRAEPGANSGRLMCYKCFTRFSGD